MYSMDDNAMRASWVALALALLLSPLAGGRAQAQT
jgi:hypothetical protein